MKSFKLVFIYNLHVTQKIVSVPIWVLKIHYLKKLVLLFNTNYFLITNLSFLFFTSNCLPFFVTKGENTKKNCTWWFSTINLLVKKSKCTFFSPTDAFSVKVLKSNNCRDKQTTKVTKILPVTESELFGICLQGRYFVSL